jgi:plasmid maintenance system killer protein
VHVKFGDEALHRLATDRGFCPTSWEADVVKAYRLRFQSLVAAKDPEDLRALRCLDLQPEEEHTWSRSSIRLVGQARLLLDFDADNNTEVTVVGIVKSHTREVSP